MGNLAVIVEGQGDEAALPTLIRRICVELCIGVQLPLVKPLRYHRQKLIRPGELERAVNVAAITSGADGRILIALDSDGDCPATLAPSLLHRAQAARADRRIGIVLAHREFEAWLMAGSNSLVTTSHLRSDAPSHPDPEGVANPKGWIKSHASAGLYSPAIDQVRFASALSLSEARRSNSFDKLVREVTRLLV